VKDQPLVYIGAVQTFIFALQLFVFRDQAKKLRQTVEAAKEQSADTKRSIEQSTRAANAMEEFSKSAERGSKAAAQSVVLVAKQMRAYLSVRIDGGFYQDRGANFRFEVRPMLINTGLTPALRVGYAARADVLSFPLEDGFVFPALGQPQSVFGLLAPQQNFIMNAYVDRDYFDDAEAEDIKRGRGKRVYMWGTITYEDVFGETRHTNFCQSIFWIRFKDESERIFGNYVDRHNDAS
jgi:hypothetical protein